MAKDNKVKKDLFKYLQKITGFSVPFQIIETSILEKKNYYAPPIFIIGPPRSGSTILYQLLIKYYNFCYFTNFSNLFFKSPFFADYILHLLSFKKFNSIKKSDFGFIRGFSSPSEAGGIFRYWFDSQEYNYEKKNLIKKTIYSLSNRHNAPFLNKNLYNSFRMDKIHDLFPNALFIHIYRNPLYIAQSLILARKRENGSQYFWFGVKPPNYEDIKKIKDPFEQVFHQIFSISESIKNFSDRHSINIINIKYEDLCEKTRSELLKINNFYYEISKYKIIQKEDPIHKIKKMNYQKLSDKDWNILCKKNNYFLI
jgi:hypothetical protein